MGSSEEKIPEFFKTFRSEFYSETLKIPDAFLEHLSENIPKKVVLKNCFDDCWPVEIVETEDGLCFQEGWSKLVSDYSLLGGEFMVFKYDGHSTFEIRIRDTSEFEKQPVGSFAEETKMPTEEENEEDEEEDLVTDQAEHSARREKLGRGGNYSFTGYHVKNLEKGIADFFPSNNPFFVTKIRKNDGIKNLIIPYDIWKDSGLNFGDKIKIQDPNGRVFNGKIVIWKDGRHTITNFWKQLCMFNKVTEDDSVICELIPSTTNTCKLIKVQIIHPSNV